MLDAHFISTQTRSWISNTVLGSPINVGHDAVGIAYNLHNYDMYVVDDIGGTVSVIEGDRGTVIGSPINIGVGAHAIAYSPDNNYMYVTNEDDGTVSVDSLHNTIAGSPIKVGYNDNYPIDITYNPDNHYMYVTMRNNTVIVINPSSNTVVGSPIKVAQQGYPFGINAIAYDPDNKDMYVSIDDYRAFGNPSGSYDGTVSVIDSFHNTVVGSPINVGQFPVGIGYSPYSKEMYVVNNKDGTVSVINPSSNTVVGSPIRVGNSPDYVAGAYPDNYEMYVTNRGDGTVSMINASSNTVVGSPIRVGNNPGGNPLGIAYCSGP